MVLAYGAGVWYTVCMDEQLTEDNFKTAMSRAFSGGAYRGPNPHFCSQREFDAVRLYCLKYRISSRESVDEYGCEVIETRYGTYLHEPYFEIGEVSCV